MALTGREKATIFLSILGADVSSRVMRYLPEEIAEQIAAGVNHLPSPSSQALAEVLDEYQSFLALPESATPERVAPPPRPAAPRRSYAPLMYERPQTAAFILSLLTDEEKAEALQSLPRERPLIEELLASLRANPLRPKLEAKFREVFAGKVF